MKEAVIPTFRNLVPAESPLSQGISIECDTERFGYLLSRLGASEESIKHWNVVIGSKKETRRFRREIYSEDQDAVIVSLAVQPSVKKLPEADDLQWSLNGSLLHKARLYSDVSSLTFMKEQVRKFTARTLGYGYLGLLFLVPHDVDLVTVRSFAGIFLLFAGSASIAASQLAAKESRQVKRFVREKAEHAYWNSIITVAPKTA